MAIEDVDFEIAEALEGELDRQRYKLNLIASENYASRAVLEAQGSIMTNKYAEGYPGRRYYGGCEFVDVAEGLAIERAKKLFGCDHVNVQPHSGSQANMAVYFALLELGDTIMGMDLNHGGHLSHGSKVSFSGKYFNIVHYGVEKGTGRIDYDNVAKIAREAKPKLIVCGASAYPREIDFKAFREIADEVGAVLMADIAHIAGLVVAGVHPSPVGHAQIVTTTTHKTLRGPRGGMILCDEEYANPINKTVFPGVQGGPLMHVIAAKAVAFKEALSKEFREYNVQIVKNAKKVASELLKLDHDLVSGGTDNHLMLLDLTGIGVTGKDTEAALADAGIILNKNMIPFDTLSPFIASGVRIGTPAVTSRGMREPEMVRIAGWIDAVIRDLKNEELRSGIRGEVRRLCKAFPVY